MIFIEPKDDVFESLIRRYLCAKKWELIIGLIKYKRYWIGFKPQSIGKN